MIYLQIISTTRQMAIFEIVAILSVAALLGYLLSQLLMSSRLRILRAEVEQRQNDLRECRYMLIYDTSFIAEPVVKIQPKIEHKISEPVSVSPDDLKIIEGIGPKIEEILNKHDIYNYSVLADTSPVRISAILRSAGPRFQMHDPTSWPQQAALAKNGKWEQLNEMKRRLISGNQI
ncbi:hypothetical protein [Dyadobacter sp. NIV53]|uniref:hypothetical protein n=1 Tax=Dyadobacter sp. NIV53 TaxID=2861765 RepID=UPI001C87E0BB|nr:hypothetical protein [Dyadobacter sp. NIV53]